MKLQLKAAIEKAIDDALDANAEEDLWDGYVHDELVMQMTSAAEQVFDAAMDAQKFAEQNK